MISGRSDYNFGSLQIAGTFVSIPYSDIQAFESGGVFKQNVVMVMKKDSKIQEEKCFNTWKSTDNPTTTLTFANKDFINVGIKMLENF